MIVCRSCDDAIEVVERDRKALEEMGPRLGLAEIVGRATCDHLAPEVEKVAERVLQRKQLRSPIDSATMFTPKVVWSGVCL